MSRSKLSVAASFIVMVASVIGAQAVTAPTSGAATNQPSSSPGAYHHGENPSGASSSTGTSTPSAPLAPRTSKSNVVVPSSWSIVPTPNVNSNFHSLNGVSCLSVAFCMAVGDYDSGTGDLTLAEQWNGTAWSIVSTPNLSVEDDSLSSVSCTSPSSCMAVGNTYNGSIDQTLAEQWNGTTWSLVSTPDTASTRSNSLYGVSCFGPSACTAVGYGDSASAPQTLIEQWNGATWSIVSSPNASTTEESELNGVSCVGSLFCMATGFTYNGTRDATLAEVWTGSAWTIVSSPSPVGAGGYFDGVSCASTTFCVGVGASDSPQLNLVEQWNGSAWTLESVPNPNASFGQVLIGVDCFGPTSCVAGGYVNTINSSDDTYTSEGLTWDGSTWALTSFPSPPVTPADQDDQTNAFSCIAGQMCVGVGYAVQGTGNPLTFAVSASIARPGYDLVASDGGIFTHGGAGFFGSEGGTMLNKPVVGMAQSPDGGGYWLVASDGGIFAHGDAGFFGSEGGTALNKPIVGMASTPDGQGYWLVASDGGVFAHGTAQFYGSMGGQTLNKPIVGMASTPDGKGYWLVASDGGIFNFGDAGFYGSLGSIVLNKPVVGMASTPDAKGYWLVASDGGIFAKGDAGFFGSQGSTVLNKPVVGMASTPDGQGYWLVASDGGVFTEGDAAFFGSEGGTVLNEPIVGMAA